MANIELECEIDHVMYILLLTTTVTQNIIFNPTNIIFGIYKAGYYTNYTNILKSFTLKNTVSKTDIYVRGSSYLVTKFYIIQYSS